MPPAPARAASRPPPAASGRGEKASSRVARSTESPPSPRSVKTTATSLAVLASPARAASTTIRARRGGSARREIARPSSVMRPSPSSAPMALSSACASASAAARRGIEEAERRRIGDAPERAVEREAREIGGENFGRGVRLKSAGRGLLPQAIADAGLDAPGAPAPLVGVGPADPNRLEAGQADVRLVDGNAHEPAVDDDPHTLDRERRLRDRGREHDLAPTRLRRRDGEILRARVERPVERRDVDIGPPDARAQDLRDPADLA